MIVSSEAIVLKSFKYSDSSKIVTFFTKEEGLITAIAKGVRKKNSKYGSIIEPINRIFISYYKYPNKSLYLLSNADLNDSFKNIKSNYDKLTIALSLAELILKVQDYNEKNTNLYDLILQTLNLMDDINSNSLSLIIAFQLNLIKILGFDFEIDKPKQNNIEKTTKYIVDFEGFFIRNDYQNENHNKYAINSNILDILHYFKKNTLDHYVDYELSRKDALITIDLLTKYISFHLDKMIHLKALDMLLD